MRPMLTLYLVSAVWRKEYVSLLAFKFNNIYVMILKILKVIDLQEHR